MYLATQRVDEILSNPVLRMHVMTVRSRGLLASENNLALGASLLGVASLNLLNRRVLGAFFERVLFHDPRDLPPFYDLSGFPIAPGRFERRESQGLNSGHGRDSAST